MGEPYFACMVTAIFLEIETCFLFDKSKIFGEFLCFSSEKFGDFVFRRIFAEELIKGENYGV